MQDPNAGKQQSVFAHARAHARAHTRTVLRETREAVERERAYYSLGAIAMYALTLIGEVPVIVARFLVTTMIVAIVMVIQGNTRVSPDVALLALAPTMWSALALVVPLGSGWWWRVRAGGRNPSSRERQVYEDAVELLQAHSQTPLPLPLSWFVIDTPHPDAAVVGGTLMLSRGLLETDHVPAVLAHELGHLATSDGRLTAALNRLVICTNPFAHGQLAHSTRGEDRESAGPRRPRDHWIARTREAHKRFAGTSDPNIEPMIDLAYGMLKVMFYISLFAKGGLGLWLTRPAWGRYWRAREYRADRYAASLGQADELADFLEVHALIHDHPIPFMWLSEQTHPPTELRIDRLRNPAGGGEPSCPPEGGPLPGPSEPGPLTA